MLNYFVQKFRFFIQSGKRNYIVNNKFADIKF